MAVVIDTSAVPVADRADAFASAMNATVFPSHVTLDPAVVEPHYLMERWVLGGGIDVVQTRSSGHRLRRTATQIRSASPEQVSLAMDLGGAVRVEQGGRMYDSLHDIHAVDATSPFSADFRSVGNQPSVSMCAQVDFRSLGMPAHVVSAALPRLTASPLYGLFRTHLARLAASAASVEDTPAAALLGSATCELARALLSSAAVDDRQARDSMASVLSTRIDAYIQQNLANPGLGASSVAAAHSISVRYLYRLYAERGVSLEQQIITGRLELARRELARGAASTRTIEAVAHAAGFKQPQFFTRKFREAYGTTPREWRQLHTQPPAAGATPPLESS